MLSNAVVVVKFTAMRLAWFRPRSADPPAPSDDTALLIRALRARVAAIDEIDESRAHDFVWRHARTPYDLCVFELGGRPAHRFVAAYAVHYPGIVLLRGLPRHQAAVLAARLVVAPHEPAAQALADEYPGARVRTVTPGVEPLPDSADAIVEALRWPPDGAALTYAISGMAAGRAVIVFDGPETADWPSLDPQNWSTRDRIGERPPVCVSIDPRDHLHSLRLARARLAQDAALRAALGRAAQAWWRQHATVAEAVTGFERLIDEASRFAVPSTAVADEGLWLAGRLLGDFGFDAHAVIDGSHR
jgi:hypothetical protein